MRRIYSRTDETRSSLAALNLTIAQQRRVIERVRQSTNSVCQGFSKSSRVSNGNYDTYSIFSSTIGDEEFAFDNEVINTQVYRRVLNKASKAQVLQNADPGHEPELFDEPLIDLSDEPKVPSVPTLDDSCVASRWFGSFDGALPAQLSGDLTFLASANERAQDPTSLEGVLPAELAGDSTFMGSAHEKAQDQTSVGGTPSPLSAGHVPPLDRLPLNSLFTEPSVAELEAYDALDTKLDGYEQGKKREQYFKEDDPGEEGNGYKTNTEIWPNEKLAQGGRNQEAHLAIYQQQMMEETGEQAPDLSEMQTTVQPSIIPENSPPVSHARVAGSSNLSKATITTKDTHGRVLEDTAPENRYETAPSSPLLRPSRPLPLYSHAPFSFESLRAVMAPLDRPISRTRSDASGYESVRDLHTNSIPRRTPSLQMGYRLGTLSGVATSKSSQSLGRVEPPDIVVAKQPDQYTDKGVRNSAFTHDHIVPWQEDSGKPFPPIIDMQSVPRSNLERSGSEGHDFILSALTWLVDPYSYTITDTVVSNSISETTIVLFGSMSGKTSACATYAAQNPELTDYAALTVSFTDYKIRVPMIMNRFGVTQESIVTLRDTGAELSAHDIDKLSRRADVVLLCYPVSEGSFDNVSEYVGTYPSMLFAFTERLKWFPQIREQCPQVPVILVGMRTDERKTAYRSGGYVASSYEDGLICAKMYKTAAYVECSSTNVQSINQMFEAAIRLALVSKLKVPQVQSPRLKHRLSRWWQGHKERLSI